MDDHDISIRNDMFVLSSYERNAIFRRKPKNLKMTTKEIKKAVKERDKVCQMCGCTDAPYTYKRARFQNPEGRTFEEVGQLIFYDELVLNQWEIDHIIPVGMGGKAWDVLNMQLLCKTCHKLKSAKETMTIREHIKNKRIEYGLGVWNEIKSSCDDRY